MSAVIHAQIPGSGQLALASGDPQRVLVFGAAGPVTLADFLAQAQHLAGSLPEARHVVHLAEDRHRFLLGFCAAAMRGQPGRAPWSCGSLLQPQQAPTPGAGLQALAAGAAAPCAWLPWS